MAPCDGRGRQGRRDRAGVDDPLVDGLRDLLPDVACALGPAHQYGGDSLGLREAGLPRGRLE